MTSDFLQTIRQGLQSGQGTDFLSTLRQGLNNPQPQSTTPIAPPPPNFGIPHEQIQSDVQNLKAKGTPLADIHSTIDSLPQITDKVGAKNFAEQIYNKNELKNNPTEIKAPQKTFFSTIANKVEDVANRLPFFGEVLPQIKKAIERKSIMTHLQEETYKTYPFTQLAKNILQGEAQTYNTAPEFDAALQIGRFTGDVAEIKDPITGKIQPAQKKGELFIGANQRLPYGGLTHKESPTTKSQIQIKDYMDSTIAHELTHALVNSGYYDGQSLANFDEAWKEVKKQNKDDHFYSRVDVALATDPHYAQMSDFDKANERLAYTMQRFGSGGLSKFPSQFQTFYRSILSNKNGGSQ